MVSSSNEDPRLANGGNRKIPYVNPALWLGPDPGPATDTINAAPRFMNYKNGHETHFYKAKQRIDMNLH